MEYWKRLKHALYHLPWPCLLLKGHICHCLDDSEAQEIPFAYQVTTGCSSAILGLAYDLCLYVHARALTRYYPCLCAHAHMRLHTTTCAYVRAHTCAYTGSLWSIAAEIFHITTYFYMSFC